MRSGFKTSTTGEELENSPAAIREASASSEEPVLVAAAVRSAVRSFTYSLTRCSSASAFTSASPSSMTRRAPVARPALPAGLGSQPACRSLKRLLLARGCGSNALAALGEAASAI